PSHHPSPRTRRPRPPAERVRRPYAPATRHTRRPFARGTSVRRSRVGNGYCSLDSDREGASALAWATDGRCRSGSVMSSEPVEQAREHGWIDEATSFGRAFAGAYLFGIPLLFTMEMWWIGTYADLWKLIVFLALTFLANVVLTYLAGFKPRRETSLIASIDESVDTLAVGVVASVIVLLVLNRIAPGDPLDSILGKVIIQAIPLSIGASLANAVFDRHEGRTGEQPSAAESHPWRDALNDLGATIIGGVFIGFSIAPTDEIQLLAASLDIYHEVALVALTLVIGYIIVFTSGFDPESAGP